MQHVPHGLSPRTPPSQSRPRKSVVRSADSSTDATHELRPVAPGTPHVRPPVLIREPTIFESLSRNLRTLFPSGISTPTPRRRPVSHGALPPMENLAPEGERILWAGWDQIDRARVLILAYPTGLQIWDTTDLDSVRELLNLRADTLCTPGPLLAAAIVPRVVPHILAVLSSTHLTIYSLATHSVINQVPFNNPSALAARASFIIVATTQPHALHVLSTSLSFLHVISLTTPPVFAASHRLLAYATTTPPQSPSSPPAAFLATSTSPVRALWTAVEDHAWNAAAAGIRFSRSAPAASGHWFPNPTQTLPSDPAPWIAVLDLDSVTDTSLPRQIAHFAPFDVDSSGVAHLAFSSTKGAGPPLLCVAPPSGHGVAVFEIRGAAMPWHRYALRRGVTSATVERIVYADGGRWVGVVTARKTVHVFATNKDGGLPDVRAHLEGRSINNSLPRPLSVELAPLVRLRVSPELDSPRDADVPLDPFNDLPAPLALTFLSPRASRSLSASLRPSSPYGVQDILLFDPTTGVLALRRLFVEQDAEIELAARESVVATWSLKRGRDWSEVFGMVTPGSLVAGPVKKRNFLPQAELSTHAATFPRSIYLSHQFSFHALGEDYSALLARNSFAAVPTVTITVRKPIEVRSGGENDRGLPGEEFVQTRRTSSFDEPLASAMRAQLDYYPGQSPPILPMLPNGHPSSVLGALPIRTKHVAAGVQEGIGRLVRSPVLWPHGRRTSGGVPLTFEFDEADEALFLDADEQHDGSAASVSVATPEDEEAWDDGAGKTVAEAETFDEISAAGFLDEEQAEGKTTQGREVGAHDGDDDVVGRPVLAEMRKGKGAADAKDSEDAPLSRESNNASSFLG